MTGKRPPDRVYGVSLLAIAIIYYQFTYVTPDIGIRIFAISLFRVPYFIGGAIALRSCRQFRVLLGARILIGLLLVGALWYLLRGCLALSSDELAVLFRTGPMQSANFLIAAVGNILITIALFRIEAELAIRQAFDLAAQLQSQREGLEVAVAARTRELEQEVAERKLAEIAVTAEKDRAERALADLLTTQNHLVQAEKMASLGRMVAGAAHEINTPLGVSITTGSLLSDRLKELEVGLKAGRLRKSHMEDFLVDAHEGCGLLLSNLQRAADLVHSFKQVATDQISDDRRRVVVGTLLSDVVISLGPLWRKAGHRVDIVCPDLIELECYPGVIAQILTNLITNSLIHGFAPGQRGVLVIEAALSDPDAVALAYSDNGKGIAAEARDKVFEPFFTTRRGLGSTGLGLHIIYNLVVSKLGGTIELESAEGRGVRFVMRFPRSPEPGQTGADNPDAETRFPPDPARSALGAPRDEVGQGGGDRV